MFLQSIPRARGDLRVSSKAHKKVGVCLHQATLKFIMSYLPVVCWCQQLPAHILSFPPSILASSWLKSPHPHFGLVRSKFIPAVSVGTNVVHNPDLQCYAQRHRDCSIFLLLFEALYSCFSFLRYHCSISYCTSNTWKKIMKQTLSFTGLFIPSESKAVSVSSIFQRCAIGLCHI